MSLYSLRTVAQNYNYNMYIEYTYRSTLLSLSSEGNVEWVYSPVSIQISPVQLLASLTGNHTSEWHKTIKWPLQ